MKRSGRALVGAQAWLLGSILLVSLALFAFVQLADEVLEGETGAFDRAVLLALRNPANLTDPIGPAWLKQAARDMTALGGNTVLALISLAVIGYLLVARRPGSALLVFAAELGGTLLVATIKLLVARPRPDIVPHAVQVYTASFPSSHAMLSAVTYLTLGALLARVAPSRAAKIYLQMLAILLALLVGASRIYLGVHWPTDVLAGWCLGAAWALVCWNAALRLQRRGAIKDGQSGQDGA